MTKKHQKTKKNNPNTHNNDNNNNNNSGRIPSVPSLGNMSEVSAQSADTVDERSAEAVSAAKDAILEASHEKFVASVLGGTADTSVVAVGAMTDSVRVSSIHISQHAYAAPDVSLHRG